MLSCSYQHVITHQLLAMQATRSGALDLRSCAEGRVWKLLPDSGGVSVTTISLEVGFTPQYTRKVLASLRAGDLADTAMGEMTLVWWRKATLADVVRYIKARSEPTGARSRRALCLRTWRYIHQSGASQSAEQIAVALNVQASEIYTALRTLKANDAIRFLRGKSRGDCSTWDALGTPLQARIALTRRDATPTVMCATRHSHATPSRPMINSIWALGLL